MIRIVLALAGVLIILVVSEVLWRKTIIKGEGARKFVHILVGSFVAFWPYFLSWRQIQLMSLAFLLVVAVSINRRIFHAVHEVNRKTMGELLFPIGIGVSALIAPSPIVFAAALLHLSLADGLAAVVGTKYGVLHRYNTRNYTKTLAGSLTFFAVSLMIVAGTVLLSGTSITWPLVPLLIWLPLATSLVENLAVAGTDNILVPLLVIVVLRVAGV